ncbi:DUF6492 family protein [Aurantimonas sp. Leaf443]|uniref:DUF6492 family protein n=1 Tax=Aurantimonas sp. Leaf443 TaxID=1736378 RepID=UPI0006F99469|nr:DUF6492 family protein [Aurantimonas sp. Leaf443]KQT87914.1 hypothetical protein ASG48_00115 [Aurantimonas sp. Leaf443]
MRTAIVTASYRGDFERCRLLCDSIDARVTGHTRHLILVDRIDVPLFRSLAGPRREIVGEAELFPAWLRSFPDPTTFGRRRVWPTPFGPPLRGWHVQQLRRIAMGGAMAEEVMVSLDSDVVFLKPFDVGAFQRQGRLLFHKVPNALAAHEEASRSEHRAWSRKAGELLGIAAPDVTDEGYVGTLIAWRTDAVRGLLKRIEAVSGRSWLRRLGATRSLSECTLYGRYVDEVEGRPDLYEPSPVNFCRMHWVGAALKEGDLRAFAEALAPHEVAAGIQSFTGTDPRLIRRAAGLG